MSFARLDKRNFPSAQEAANDTYEPLPTPKPVKQNELLDLEAPQAPPPSKKSKKRRGQEPEQESFQPSLPDVQSVQMVMDMQKWAEKNPELRSFLDGIDPQNNPEDFVMRYMQMKNFVVTAQNYPITKLLFHTMLTTAENVTEHVDLPFIGKLKLKGRAANLSTHLMTSDSFNDLLKEFTEQYLHRELGFGARFAAEIVQAAVAVHAINTASEKFQEFQANVPNPTSFLDILSGMRPPTHESEAEQEP
jgi:hypothetical protein